MSKNNDKQKKENIDDEQLVIQTPKITANKISGTDSSLKGILDFATSLIPLTPYIAIGLLLWRFKDALYQTEAIANGTLDGEINTSGVILVIQKEDNQSDWSTTF